MNIDAIGVICENIQQSIRFYELFGLKLKREGEGDHWEALTPSGLRLMLDSTTLIKELNPDWTPSKGSGIVMCFKVETAQEVDTLYAKITQAGHSGIKEPWDAFWGQRYASVADPDNNQIDIFANL